VDREGQPEVVFVPGFMQRGDAWRPVAERLGTRYRSTCLDHRAQTFAGRLEEIRSETPPGAALVGYSMGGRLALHAALRWPRALGAMVLVGTSAGIEDDHLRAERQAADERLAAWMESSEIEEVVERWESLAVFATQSPELRDALRPGRLSQDPYDLATLLRTAGQGALPPVWGRVEELRMPLLAVGGEADDAYVEPAYRLARLARRGTVRLVAGAGHAPQLEQPDGFARILMAFLEEVTPIAPASEARP
jgi:2-succinyl-6-hydroxy-2,4-cyclohexadiene-1-carboxylate synthase